MISNETWEEINKIIIGYAEDHEVEIGRKVIVGCTAVESNNHDVNDSELLVHATRVLARLLAAAKAGMPGKVLSHSKAMSGH